MTHTLPKPATARGGRFRMEILTHSGWTPGRHCYRRLRTARQRAYWFGSLSQVREVRIIDEVEGRIVFEFANPRGKP